MKMNPVFTLCAVVAISAFLIGIFGKKVGFFLIGLTAVIIWISSETF